MKWNAKTRTAMAVAQCLPDGLWFDIRDGGEIVLVATSQSEVAVHRRQLAAHVPGPWQKRFTILKRWEYATTLVNPDGDSAPVVIVGCTEAPPTCTPIVKRQVRVQRTPIEWREERIEEEVVIGYDCGGSDDAAA
jgi:hypothetical protein